VARNSPMVWSVALLADLAQSLVWTVYMLVTMPLSRLNSQLPA
jgi:hypothetical protein